MSIYIRTNTHTVFNTANWAIFAILGWPGKM